MHISIVGTGSALPQKAVSNDDLSRTLDTSDAWIYSRTGIRYRHIAGPEETFATLGEKAARDAMTAAGVRPEEVELIIAATATAGNVTPSSACLVQARIGVPRAVCFDLNAACSGFLYALRTAEALMRSGVAGTALILGGEILSHFLDWNDRSTCVLFGDAVGAVVLRASEDPDAGDILGTVLAADGSQGACLTGRSDPDNHYLHMDGQQVFRFAVRTVPEVIEEVLRQTKTEKEQVRYYVLHQANARIIDAAARRMQEPLEKFPMNMERTANTSAASIPILLDEMARGGKISRGDRLVLAGFGGGLTWGASVVRW